MGTKINDFRPGTTKAFKFTISVDSTVQDISSDTVTFRMKRNKLDVDPVSVISSVADVSTSGANGVAAFTLSTTVTDVVVAEYYCDVEWVTNTGKEYIIYDNTINVLTRVSDA